MRWVARWGRALLAGLALSLAVATMSTPTATAQTSTDEVPTQDIIPRPNTGAEPEDAGDRGGALQLAIPLVIVAAVGGAIWHLRRQSRQALDSSG